MSKRATAFIAAIGCLALAASLVLVQVSAATLGGCAVVTFLCAIGWIARHLTHEGTTQHAVGRVYYFVFPAAAIALADWTVPLLVGVTIVAIERARSAELPKIVFNTSATVLATALGILCFRLVGGTGWSGSARVAVLPAVLLLVVNRLVNDSTLATVLALTQRRPVRATWRAVAGRTLVDDVLVAPLVGLLAYAISFWGFIATAVIAASLIWVNRLYQANHELTKISEELLELMVGAIEARDPYTSGHSRRVSRMAMIIGRALMLPEREVDRIGVAGLLHDVGKIHEKYAIILRKPDRLTSGEWAVMKHHPEDGEALVRKVSRLADILPAVRHHHEKWDGSGYPDRLAGESIPFQARVLAFADTIDAMMSSRPYRRGLTPDEVRREIIKWAGKQFDPDIATKLLASSAWDSLFDEVDVAHGDFQPVELARPA